MHVIQADQFLAVRKISQSDVIVFLARTRLSAEAEVEQQSIGPTPLIPPLHTHSSVHHRGQPVSLPPPPLLDHVMSHIIVSSCPQPRASARCSSHLCTAAANIAESK